MAATPIYRLNLWQREYYDTPKITTASKTMSHWDDAEMHEDKTQVYIIISGTGTVILGGQAEKEQAVNGQHSGGPIRGGTVYKVKAGD
jgi:mannose-6-phosphate isomerase-like protein (cupin superfamily)